MALCLLASLGFHFYSFYEVYKVSRGKTPRLSDDPSRKKQVGMSNVKDSGGHSSSNVTYAGLFFPDKCHESMAEPCTVPPDLLPELVACLLQQLLLFLVMVGRISEYLTCCQAVSPGPDKSRNI